MAPRWTAPELVRNDAYNTKVDIFSFGMVLWELCHRNVPFQSMTSKFDIEDAIARGDRPPVSNNCPRNLALLMRRCWQKNAEIRPSFKEIVFLLEEMLAEECPVMYQPGDPRDGDNGPRAYRALSVVSSNSRLLSSDGVMPPKFSL